MRAPTSDAFYALSHGTDGDAEGVISGGGDALVSEPPALITCPGGLNHAESPFVPRRTNDDDAGFPSGLDSLAQGCLLFALVARQSDCVRTNRPLKLGRRPVDDPLKLPPG